MKHFILACLVITGLFIACNSNKSKDPETADAAAGPSTEMTADDKADDIQTMLEQMKKLPALSTDKIKAMFPEELIGIKLTEYKPINNEGYEIGRAIYKSDDGKELNVMIYDCVGEAGVGKYNIMYLSAVNMESADETGYSKPVNFNGGKAIESYEKNQDKYGILFTSGNRLLVSIEGEKTGLDTVKQAAKSLNLKTN